MRAFIDTSAMMKKYIDEIGGEEFDNLLLDVTQIVVAPTYIVEAHAAVERRLRDKTIVKEQIHVLREEINRDAAEFHQVNFTKDLCDIALHLITIYPLTALDGIQLASASMAEGDIFVTSDKQLFKYAKQELKKVKLIG
jgi:predicted nucleic acid-binding protein